jgi:ABC-type multidrug transport system fused ATPase/permease subunit
MERDPVRYAWKHAPAAHLLAFAAVALLIPVTWLALDLPRVIVDNALLGQAFRRAATAAFLPLVIDLPYPFLEEPLTLFSGISLDRTGYFIAACVTLALAALVRALILGITNMLRGGLVRRLAAELRLTLFRRVVAARFSARDEASSAAELAGRGIATVGPFLGDAVMVPVLAASEILIAIVFAMSLSLWLGLAMVAVTIVHAFAVPLAVAAERRRDEARGQRESEVARAAQDVARRSLAIKIHGTAAREEASFVGALASLDLVWAGLGRRLTLANMARGFVREFGSVVILIVGGSLVIAGLLSVGSLVAALLASLLLPRPIAALVAWRQRRRVAGALLVEIARIIGILQARERRLVAATRVDNPEGRLAAQGVAALDPISGVRIAGIDFAIDLPAHVAVTGASDSGADVFARLIGGAIEPTAGMLLIGSVELPRLDGIERADRVAFAGGEPVLLAGSLRDNLLYGATRPIDDKVLVAALWVAGLDSEVYGLGLAGTLPGADAEIADAIVGARIALRQALAAKNCSELVDPFDPGRYNQHATVAENLMFGVPVGDTFREANLARQPFVRAVLETEGLTAPLAEIGLAMAKNMVEIFAGVPDGHPLFAQFSFFSAGERGAYEELVARQAERRRGAAAQRDRDLLVALALRYVETRHRLGLLDPAAEKRIVDARASFRSLLPASLNATVEFYDPNRLCAAASLADNLLFGRVAHDVAGAEERVREVVRRVLTEHGLDAAVFGVGLSSRMTEREPAVLVARASALDLARCLARAPEVLVVTRLFDGLAAQDAEALAARLRRAMTGRSLFAVLSGDMKWQGFDARLDFERGTVIHMDGSRVMAKR